MLEKQFFGGGPHMMNLGTDNTGPRAEYARASADLLEKVGSMDTTPESIMLICHWPVDRHAQKSVSMMTQSLQRSGENLNWAYGEPSNADHFTWYP